MVRDAFVRNELPLVFLRKRLFTLLILRNKLARWEEEEGDGDNDDNTDEGSFFPSPSISSLLTSRFRDIVAAFGETLFSFGIWGCLRKLCKLRAVLSFFSAS